MQATERTPYPPALRQPLVEHLHGHAVHDPYRWLEDPASRDTVAWVAAQDALWRAHAAALPGRDRLHARVAALSRTGGRTTPRWRGDRQLFLRREPGADHAVLYVAGPDGRERSLVDPAALDPRGTTTLDHWQPDREGRLLAYQLSRGGDERSDLYVLDIATGAIVDGPIDRCRYSPVAWVTGGGAFYYVRAAPTGARLVLRHRVGTSPAEDTVVAGDGDPTTSYGLGLDAGGRWLVVSASRGASHDLWLADLSVSHDLRPVQEGLAARTVADVGRDGRLYVVTDLGAPRGRLCVGDPARPGPEHWADLVPEDPEAVLADFAVLDGPEPDRPLLLVARARHALGEIVVHDLATGARLGDVPLPGLGSVGALSVRGHELWFTYCDSVTTPTVYHWDARTGETVPWARPPGAAEVPDVVARRVVAASADGTPVQVVVLGPRSGGGGPRPAILYAYGGFGIPLTPTYSSFALAWVEAGGVYATAHVRGGGEEGEDWHRAGTGEGKQRSFDDLLAAAEALVADGTTTPRQLGVVGESNGGLLAAAALTQRPDLFAAAVCSAPVLDMVRYERSDLGPLWTAEYGSARDPDQFRTLLAYSPYHRVTGGVDYPAVLFTVFGGDSRVDPFHARKMCAALQAATAGPRPVLLRHEDGVGHGARAAGSGVALAADMLAFLAVHTGLDLGS
ncbi:MAG TPA: prolyl oligopeptidase family serine peptidase [Mycobacteriales bacterium]